MLYQDFKVILLYWWPLWPMMKENFSKTVGKMGRIVSLVPMPFYIPTSSAWECQVFFFFFEIVPIFNIFLNSGYFHFFGKTILRGMKFYFSIYVSLTISDRILCFVAICMPLEKCIFHFWIGLLAFCWVVGVESFNNIYIFSFSLWKFQTY